MKRFSTFKQACFWSGLFCFFILLIACAQRQQIDRSSFVMTQASESVRSGHMSCNAFSDETFYGRLKPSSQEGCFDLEILEYPSNLFEEGLVFLQLYPFSAQNENIFYGPSLAMKIYKKGWLSKDVALIKTPLISADIIERELQTSKSDFFKNHYIKACPDDPSWEAIQLVLYLKKDSESSPIPLRVSPFLLPPFLLHPQEFRDQKGNQLAVYHPFLGVLHNQEASYSSYHDLSKEMCDFNI